jgi:photosystem II stability/assembly factor-like uncharacterized protein
MSKSATLTNRFALLVIILAVLSCDSITDPDTVTPEKFTQSVYYILPGTSAIIDLESVIQNSFLTGTLNVFEKPKRGTLSYATTSMLKYKPGREFQQGEDHFVLSVVNDGKIVGKGTMTIKMKKSTEEFSCALVPVEDKIKLKPGSSSVSTRVLENDWFCDIDKSNVSISIESQPKFGQALIDNESIIYTPAAEYEDRDELIYKVTEPTGETVSYGILSFHANGEFTIQKIPNSMMTSLFFVDENTGFLGTAAGLFKTTDGGINWSLMVTEGEYFDISFADAKNGIAVLGGGGFVTTKDGGATWKVPIYLNDFGTNGSVISVALTSEMTGFIAVNDWVQSWLWDYGTTKVLKTEDGGATWKEVLANSSVPEYYDIQFINHTTGYALLSDKIFVTHDAGETWDALALNGRVNLFYAIEENKIFGVVNGAFVTSHDGTQWRPVALSSSGIQSIGFSPSAEIGFALERDGAIFKSVDKGETWVMEIMDEPLERFPFAMSIPSDDVAYFLYSDRIIKYSNK